MSLTPRIDIDNCCACAKTNKLNPTRHILTNLRNLLHVFNRRMNVTFTDSFTSLLRLYTDIVPMGIVILATSARSIVKRELEINNIRYTNKIEESIHRSNCF